MTTTPISANALGTYENPVTSATAERPTGLTQVYWYCATQPTNAITGDGWEIPPVVATPAPTPTGLPDMIVTDLPAPAKVIVGEKVTFSATVKNTGTAATPAGVVIGVAFHVDGTEVTWSDNHSTSLGIGDLVTLTADGGNAGVATWTATKGTHTLQAIVNDILRFPEVSSDNSSATVTFTVGVA